MDLAQFKTVQKRLEEQASFNAYEKLVIGAWQQARLFDFATNHEHFIPIVDPEKPNAARPFYCGGPKSGCKVCRTSTQQRADGDPKKKDWGERIKAKERFYFECLDRSPEGRKSHAESKHTKLLSQSKNSSSVGPMIFTAVGDVVSMLEKQNNDPNWANPANFDVIITKQGKDLTTKYSVGYSGDRTPLTPEELAYQHYDLKEVTKLTPTKVMDSIALVMEVCRPLQSSEIPGANAGDTSFNPATLQQAQQPTQQGQPQPLQQQQMHTLTQTSAPATAPQQQAAPQAQFNDVNFQDTKVAEPFDPAKQVRVPCANCQSTMQVTIGDTRQPKCWNCGRVFAAAQSR